MSSNWLSQLSFSMTGLRFLLTEIWMSEVIGTRRGRDRKNNIAGDFDIEVKLNKQGSLKMKAYSHTNEKLLYNNTETIQGVGVSYQESFDTLRELLRKYFGFLRKRK